MTKLIEIVLNKAKYSSFEDEVEDHAALRFLQLSGDVFDSEKHSRTNPHLVRAVKEAIEDPRNYNHVLLTIHALPEGTEYRIERPRGHLDEHIVLKSDMVWEVAEERP